MANLEQILSRYRHYGPVYRPGDEAPFSGTFICDLGTMQTPVRLQLAKGEKFPEGGGLGEATRWYETNIQS